MAFPMEPIPHRIPDVIRGCIITLPLSGRDTETSLPSLSTTHPCLGKFRKNTTPSNSKIQLYKNCAPASQKKIKQQLKKIEELIIHLIFFMIFIFLEYLSNWKRGKQKSNYPYIFLNLFFSSNFQVFYSALRFYEKYYNVYAHYFKMLTKMSL